MAKARRTTHRSSAGKKLYAVRDASGKFKDIQTYERAHRADLAKSSKKEKVAAVKAATKKAAPKKAAKKVAPKKVAKKAAPKKAAKKK
jgi:hypothetical protein